jgi:hypothetical protein
MRKLFYEIEAYFSVYNAETEEMEEVLSPVGAVVYNPTDADIEQAKAIAYNGEYTVEDDGEPEPESNPTLEDRVGTLETDTADLAEALNMILEGVTE